MGREMQCLLIALADIFPKPFSNSTAQDPFSTGEGTAILSTPPHWALPGWLTHCSTCQRKGFSTLRLTHSVCPWQAWPTALENTLKAGLTRNVVWVSVVDWHLKLAGKNTCPQSFVGSSTTPFYSLIEPLSYLRFFPPPLLFPEASGL